MSDYNEGYQKNATERVDDETASAQYEADIAIAIHEASYLYEYETA